MRREGPKVRKTGPKSTGPYSGKQGNDLGNREESHWITDYGNTQIRDLATE